MDIENYLKNIRTIYLEKKYSKAANKMGISTDRKIVVFESDDWGSIRMKSSEVYQKLRESDPKTDHHPYFRYDGLASTEDLEALFSTLTKFRDKNGNHPIVTANCAVANPDFAKIAASDFEEYHYEPFTDTLKREKGCEKSFELWKQGLAEHIFVPQLHCREHFNVKRWMRALQDNDPWIRMAYGYGMISTASCKTAENENSYMDSFNYDQKAEQQSLGIILKEGADIFEDIFGYRSESFIASCYIWGTELEKNMADAGIRYIQGEPIQRIPSESVGTSDMRQIRHYMGDRNDLGQLYLIRNCNFEPSYNYHKDWVTIALNGIRNAFEQKKPAIICSHRLNYIGRINEENRTRNLNSLEKLLTAIMKQWPDVEFMTSPEVGRMMLQNTEDRKEL